MAATIVPPPNELAAAPLSASRCPNCGSTMVDAFCAKCGELQPAHRDLSFRSLVRDSLQEFAGVDGKVLRTVWALISKPGQLTREFIDGRRGRYSRPLSFFLVLNVAFFLLQPHTGLLTYKLNDYRGGDSKADVSREAMLQARLAKSGESEADYTVRFNMTLSDQKKSMLLFAVPVFALVMAVIFAGARRYFVEHLVFAVHAYAFFILVLGVGVPAFFYTVGGWLMIGHLAGIPTTPALRLLNGEAPIIVVMLAATTLYMTLAIRRAYGGPIWIATFRAFALGALQLGLILVYHVLLFYTTFYAT